MIVQVKTGVTMLIWIKTSKISNCPVAISKPPQTGCVNTAKLKLQ